MIGDPIVNQSDSGGLGLLITKDRAEPHYKLSDFAKARETLNAAPVPKDWEIEMTRDSWSVLHQKVIRLP